jgi:hypothetical protein
MNRFRNIKIYRHPKGEHEKWEDDARQREQTVEENIGRVSVIDLYHPDE